MGGQVIPLYVLSEGANSFVFALLMVAFGAVFAIISGSMADPTGMKRGFRVAQTQGHILWILALGVNFAVKSVAFLLALYYVSALNAAVYIPLIPIFAIVLARILGWER